LNNIKAFYRWRRDEELCDFIHSQANRYCGKNPDLYEDLIQEAWLYISLLPPDTDDQCLKNTAYNAIRRFYRYTKRQREVVESAFEAFFNAMNTRF
jgi:hypothetical protein